tara:strand:+ start:4350 stop:4610 length:261 start_codon:yes stop_codon:yes gene_type:complete
VKITKSQLRQIIKEEISETIAHESQVPADSAHNVLSSVAKLLGDVSILKEMPGIEGEALETVEEMKSKLHKLLGDLQAYVNRVDPL